MKTYIPQSTHTTSIKLNQPLWVWSFWQKKL